jgi:hypothetical protein
MEPCLALMCDVYTDIDVWKEIDTIVSFSIENEYEEMINRIKEKYPSINEVAISRKNEKNNIHILGITPDELRLIEEDIIDIVLKTHIEFIQILVTSYMTNEFEKRWNLLKEKLRETKVNNVYSLYKPKYIADLIEEGYISPDGRITYAGLDDIAEYLTTKIESVTPQLLLSQFVQKDGSKYSLRTAQDAVKRNKTQ